MGSPSVLISVAVLFLLASTGHGQVVKIYPCDSVLYCQGILLETVTRARIFPDTKSFVDSSLKVDPGVAFQRFQNLSLSPNSSKADVEQFVNDTFNPRGNELDAWSPPDYMEEPSFLRQVTDTDFKQFGKDLCRIWKDLGRKMKSEVRDFPNRYSLVYSDHPVVVPGGRFLEFYYWDSYWVILGLLRCQMFDTVHGMLENFIEQIELLGFVPNGGRLYYHGRSQPPLLTAMVYEYYKQTGNLTFLNNSLPILIKEYGFWATNRTVNVTTDQGYSYIISRYATYTNTPRPESYVEDYDTASGLSETEAAKLYRNLASAAESGWDFSSRWFENETDVNATLKSLRTTDIIPVDLNSILCMNERILAEFSYLTGMHTLREDFLRKFQQRRQAIQDLFWDPDKSMWFDWYMPTKSRRNNNFYPSGMFPLFAGCSDNYADINKIISYLTETKVLTYPGGIPISLQNSGQQWDFPASWPPLNHVVIVGLANANTENSRKLAKDLAQVWVRGNWQGFKTTNSMFEKYDCQNPGHRGGGGEYGVQLGFGWTNGVVLDLLNRYGSSLMSADPPPSTTPHTSSSTPHTSSSTPHTSSSTSLYAILTITILSVCTLC